MVTATLATAQTPAPTAPPAAAPKAAAPAATPPAASKAAAKKPRTAESLACSAEADKKGLKGKERKTFRAKCIRDAKKAAGGAAPTPPPAKADAPAKKN
ncbi:MAG: PsiF family protein [Hyphomicrobiaceae bacterium]|nr:PsiF family protein [Hyphomicrobiaceae bacterium]